MEDTLPVPVGRKKRSSHYSSSSVTGALSGNMPLYLAIGAGGIALAMGYISLKEQKKMKKHMETLESSSKNDGMNNVVKTLQEQNAQLTNQIKNLIQNQQRMDGQFRNLYTQFQGNKEQSSSKGQHNQSAPKKQTPTETTKMPAKVPMPTKVEVSPSEEDIPVVEPVILGPESSST